MPVSQVPPDHLLLVLLSEPSKSVLCRAASLEVNSLLCPPIFFFFLVKFYHVSTLLQEKRLRECLTLTLL